MPRLVRFLAFLALLLAVARPSAAQTGTPASDGAVTQYAITVDASALAVPGGFPQLGHTVAYPGWRLNQQLPFTSPMIFGVVQGTMTLRSDGPLVVVRDGSATSISPNTDASVTAGDTAVFLTSSLTLQRNVGSEPAEYYWLLVSGRMPPTREETLGFANGEVIGGLGPGKWTPLASGPVTITLRTGGEPVFSADSQVISGEVDGTPVDLAFTAGRADGATAVDLAAPAPATPTTTDAAVAVPIGLSLPPLIQSWLDAQVNEDADALAGLYTDEGIYADAPSHSLVQGHDQIAARARDAFQAQSDFKVDVIAFHQAEGLAVLEYGVSLRDQGSGQQIDLQVATVFVLSGDRIQQSTDYYDLSRLPA